MKRTSFTRNDRPVWVDTGTDVSGYIDAYNADWDNALKKINEAIKAAMPKGHGRS